MNAYFEMAREHAEAAKRMLAEVGKLEPEPQSLALLVAAAQVHATLAVAYVEMSHG